MKRIEWTEENLSALPSNRDFATKTGSRYYFPKLECKNGHVTAWIAKENVCFLCKRERTRKQAEKRRRKSGAKKFEPVTPLKKGDKFEDLTATGNMRRRQRSNRTISEQEVRCDCGNTFWLRNDQWLKTERCYNCKQRRAGYKHGLSRSIEMSLWASAKTRAKKYNREFSIEIEDLKIPTHCPILNIPLDCTIGNSPSRRPRANAPSIDRLDSDKGYTKNNIQVTSYRANVLKKDGTSIEHDLVADFLEKYDL